MEDLEIQQYQCINCCGKDVSINSFENLRLTDGMTKIFRRELKRRLPSIGDSNSDYIAICHVCNSELSSLSNSYETFHSRTHSNSLISCLSRSNGKYENENDKVGLSETSISTFKTEGDSILPLDGLENQSNEPMIQYSELKNMSRLIEYQEKIIQIKIPQLSFSLLPPTSSKYECKYCCDECGRKFFWRGFLENHLNSVHRKHETISCTLCDKLFVSKWFFDNHFKTIHGGITLNFMCTMCGDNFISQNQLNSHNLLIHTLTNQPFKCNHCETAYNKIEGIALLREHLIKFHPKTSQAKVAEFNTRLERYLSRPIHSRGVKIPCPSCEVEFLDRRMLYTHIAFAHFDQKICDECSQTFSSDIEFAEHRRDTNHFLTHCRYCPKDLKETRALIKHLRFFHDPGRRNNYFRCEMCTSNYINHRGLKLHYKWHVRHPATNIFHCPQCESKFTILQEFQEHMKTSHQVLKKKPTCKRIRRKRKRTASADSDLEEPLPSLPILKRVSKTGVSKCTLCHLEISGSGVLSIWKHFVEYHPKTSEADVSVTNLDRYQQNSKIKGKICNANQCFICKAFFTSVLEKDKHDEIIHKKVFCQICANNFSTELQLRKHEAAVHNEFPCKCCDYVAADSQNFHSHLLQEHLVQPYICEFCGKYTKGELNRLMAHYYKHLKCRKVKHQVQDFVCPQCHFKFTSEDTLKRHQMTKCKMQPTTRRFDRVRHTCRMCGETFSRTYSYEKHMMDLHKIYAGYECEECGTLYYDFKGMNLHIRRVHNGATKEGEAIYFNEIPPPKNFSFADKKYKCPRSNCGKLSPTVNQYNTHITRDHLGLNILNGEAKEVNPNACNSKFWKIKKERINK